MQTDLRAELFIAAWFVKAKNENKLNVHRYRVLLNELYRIFKIKKLFMWNDL